MPPGTVRHGKWVKLHFWVNYPFNNYGCVLTVLFIFNVSHEGAVIGPKTTLDLDPVGVEILDFAGLFWRETREKAVYSAFSCTNRRFTATGCGCTAAAAMKILKLDIAYIKSALSNY